MKPIEYERAYTWESTNYGSDEVSLALLSAEIKFYDYVLNDKEFNELRVKNGNRPLTDKVRLSCTIYLHMLNTTLKKLVPLYQFNDTLKFEVKNTLINLRDILNIQIVNTLG